MIIGDIVERNHWRFPQKKALVFEEKEYTFKHFTQRVYSLANALIASGLSKGDKVAFLLSYNTPESMEIIYATVIAGMIAVPLNSRFSDRELLNVVSKCDVKIIIFEQSFEELVHILRPDLPMVEKYVCIPCATGANMLSYEDLITQQPPTKPEVKIDEENIAALMHTSGTTGHPKEAIWTHRTWLAGVRDIIIRFQLTENDVILMFTPYYHIPFTWFNTAIFYMGGTIVTIRRPDPELILNAIQREKVTIVSHFVPTTLLRVLDYPKVANYDLSTVRYFMYGAAPMPIPILRRAIPLLAKKFIQLYGFTEQSGAVASLSPEDHILEGTEKQMRRLSSCGKEMPSNDIRVINNRGELAASGETGEIVVRGDNLAEGYWKEPEQTNKFFKNGWYYTGDLGTYDEDKYIYITGRSKDIIISGGENITPRQVEDVIYEHPSVDMVAVIGVPDPSWGEAVIAIIVPKNGAKITEDEIIGWSKERLAHYKVPKSVYFVESLPLTTTGKIKKWVLKEKYGYL